MGYNRAEMGDVDHQSPATRSIGRLTLNSGPGWMRVVAPRVPKYSGYLGAVLVLGVLFLLSGDLRRAFPPHDLYMWVLVSIYPGAMLLLGLWSSASRDVITIRPPALVVRRELVRLGWTRHYPLEQLSNLQFRHRVTAGRQSVSSRLTFDYEYLPRGCAFDITVQEAAELIPLIQAQFPDLVARSSTSTAIEFDDPVQVGRK